MPKKTEKSKWSRNCPKCNKVLYYSSKRNLDRAIENGKSCNTCRVISDDQKKKISKSLMGHKPPKPRRKKSEIKYTIFRDCPSCGNPIGYIREDKKKAAEQNKTVCNSCSNKIYKKSWEYIIRDEHTKQMRATKAGFNSWEEYLEKYPEKKKYKAEVWRHTYKQPLDTLENYDKRGKMGVDGAWQIDHIISIDEGYKTGLSPEKIGHISNLQMLPWKDNLLKGNNNVKNES